jgi:hypothetical protein
MRCVNVREHTQQHDRGQDEPEPGNEATAHAVQFPPEKYGELQRLGARQQRTKFSASTNVRSGTHWRRCTTSRCRIAICPAGPPNEMKPSVVQNRAASANVGCMQHTARRGRVQNISDASGAAGVRATLRDSMKSPVIISS